MTVLQNTLAADILVGIRPTYRPRGGAKDVYEATDPEVIASGPAGTGKSRACLERIHHLASTHERARFLVCRKTLASLTATGLVTYETHVADRELAGGDITYFGGSSREPAQYRYHTTGSKIMFAGLDTRQAVQKVMSAEYDAVFVQEALDISEGDWEALTTRLRNGRVPHMQIIGDTNPGAPTHWIKQRANRGGLRMIESRHTDNPVLYDDDGHLTPAGREYMAVLGRLTGVRLHRLRDGLWVAAEGVIWTDFDPAVHVVDRFPIPDAWPRYWVIDFGYTNPFVCGFWAEDPDGRLWLYREIYMTQRLVEDHARDIMAQVAVPDGGTGDAPFGRSTVPGPDGPVVWRWTEPKPQAVICDHDAEDRATLKRHIGLSTRAAHKQVKTGLELVAKRLRRAGDGRPRLFLMRDSLVEVDQALAQAKLPTCTADEIPAYVWEPPVDGRAPREEPRKKDDHGADTIRYLVADRDRGRAQIRSFGG